MDGDLAEGTRFLGRIKRLDDWHWDGAERDFKRALELDPNNALALSWYAQMLSYLGRHDEALATVKRAIDIDPVSPTIAGVLFPVLEGRGEFEEGLRLAKEAYLLNKENSNARRAYATFLFHHGEFDKVNEIGEESQEKGRIASHAALSLLAASYYRTGQGSKAAEYLSQMRTSPKLTPSSYFR